MAFRVSIYQVLRNCFRGEAWFFSKGFPCCKPLPLLHERDHGVMSISTWSLSTKGRQLCRYAGWIKSQPTGLYSLYGNGSEPTSMSAFCVGKPPYDNVCCDMLILFYHGWFWLQPFSRFRKYYGNTIRLFSSERFWAFYNFIQFPSVPYRLRNGGNPWAMYPLGIFHIGVESQWTPCLKAKPSPNTIYNVHPISIAMWN